MEREGRIRREGKGGPLSEIINMPLVVVVRLLVRPKCTGSSLA